MPALEQFQSLTGKGVEAQYESKRYRVGNLPWLLQEGAELPESARKTLETWASEAYTVVGFTGDGRLIALFALADPLKPGASEAVQALKKAGIQTVMLTGDQAASATAIARAAGIEIVESGMLPADKARYVRALQAKGHIVAMTGDGVNDAEALALANVGIAMGKGSDIALETAKMTLLNSDLRILPKALTLSSKTVKTIRQNLFWAFFYNLIGIPIAAGVLYPVNGFLLHPMIAGAAMALSSVSVVSNSLRLRNLKL
jgi:Cu2+-exporting ATPase